jgi:hypothetical protein
MVVAPVEFEMELPEEAPSMVMMPMEFVMELPMEEQPKEAPPKGGACGHDGAV